MRTIAHVDMDCFFAAVEALDHPEYRGVPLVVGGPRESPRAVVSTCSYEARAFGVRSAMPMSKAVRLCPHAVFVTGNMRRYSAVSRQIMDALRTFSPLLQQVSIDEAFLDMTGCEHFYDDLRRMGAAIKDAIKETSGLTASVGIAPNKFLAKLASDSRKPDGLMIIGTDEVDDFLMPLPVRKLWGVGDKGSEALAKYGIVTVADLRAWPLEWLTERFGRWGAEVYDRARGIDNDPVQTDDEPKSFGAECTFDSDTFDISELCRALADHTQRTGSRLRRAGKLARTVTLKVKYADFTQITRSKSFTEPFDDDDTMYNTACALLSEVELKRAVRLVGLAVSGICDSRQLSLFERPAKDIDHVLDTISQRFGAGGVIRGRDLR